MAGVLPEAIRTRTDKLGFRADPDITWRFAARHGDALRRNASEYEERWFDAAALGRLLDGGDRSSVAEFALWRVISTKLWLRANWGDEAVE
jgi:hypothetical protein